MLDDYSCHQAMATSLNENPTARGLNFKLLAPNQRVVGSSYTRGHPNYASFNKSSLYEFSAMSKPEFLPTPSSVHVPCLLEK
jgi:hypothetical protein